MHLLLFDIDGTLIRAKNSGKVSFQQAMTEVFDFNVNLSGVEFAGRTDRYIFNQVIELYTNKSNGKVEKEKLFDLLKGRYLFHLQEHTKKNPPDILSGVNDLLATLEKKENCVTALLTGNMEKGAGLKLRYLEHKFKFGSYGDQFENRNKLMDVALERFSAIFQQQPQEVYIIGDTPHDISCAHHANATAIAVATGPFSIDELNKADLILDNLDNAQSIFEELLV